MVLALRQIFPGCTLLLALWQEIEAKQWNNGKKQMYINQKSLSIKDGALKLSASNEMWWLSQLKTDYLFSQSNEKSCRFFQQELYFSPCQWQTSHDPFVTVRHVSDQGLLHAAHSRSINMILCHGVFPEAFDPLQSIKAPLSFSCCQEFGEEDLKKTDSLLKCRLFSMKTLVQGHGITATPELAVLGAERHFCFELLFCFMVKSCWPVLSRSWTNLRINKLLTCSRILIHSINALLFFLFLI